MEDNSAGPSVVQTINDNHLEDNNSNQRPEDIEDRNKGSDQFYWNDVGGKFRNK